MDTTQQFQLDDEDEERLQQARGGEASGGEEGEEAGGEGGVETDAARLAQRQKQIAYGKNTQAYQNYIKLVPKHKRKLRGKDAHPSTPDITLKASKRCWAGMVRKWRRSLHAFDALAGGGQPEAQQEDQQHGRLQWPPRQPGQQQQQLLQQQHPQQQLQQLLQQQQEVDERGHGQGQQPKRQHGWGQGGRAGGRDLHQREGRQQQQQQQQQQRGQTGGPEQLGGQEGRGPASKLTPSKRQQHGDAAPGSRQDAGGAAGSSSGGNADCRDADAPAKRSRPSEQQQHGLAPGSSGRVPVAAAGGGARHKHGGGGRSGGSSAAAQRPDTGPGAGGRGRKSWADQVDDAFGAWTG